MTYDVISSPTVPNTHVNKIAIGFVVMVDAYVKNGWFGKLVANLVTNHATTSVIMPPRAINIQPSDPFVSLASSLGNVSMPPPISIDEIGRASCREREEVPVTGVALTKEEEKA